jgi:hypothetical protein
MARGNQAQVADGFNGPLETMMDGIIPELNDFKVHLLRKSDAKFGFTVFHNSLTLRVTSIRDDSEYSVVLWNTLNPEHSLQVGHQIIEVNGISGDSSVMMDAVKQCKDIELRVRAVKKMEFLYQVLQRRDLGPLGRVVLAGDVGVDQCLICLDEYDEDDFVTQLACKHCFCAKCIGKWLTQGSRHCPLCWQEVHWSYRAGMLMDRPVFGEL